MLIDDNLKKIKELVSKKEFCMARTNEDQFLLNHEITMCDNEIAIRTLLNKIYNKEELCNEDIELFDRFEEGYELYRQAVQASDVLTGAKYRISSEDLIGQIDNYSLVEQTVIFEKMSELKLESKGKLK